MDQERILSFTKAPFDGIFRCVDCGNKIELRQGQTVPPCPRCGFREFERSEGISC